VIKAFLPTDWKFYSKKGKLITTYMLEGNVRMPPQKVKIIFRIKKNRKNGQSITINANDDHPVSNLPGESRQPPTGSF
jgi:hypothetical protein